MLLGLLAGLALGLAASATGSPLLGTIAASTAPFGDLFMRGLQMVVIPLVVAIVFAGVARLGDTRALGRLGGWALGLIVGTTLPAVVLGMGSMGLALRLFGGSPGAMEAEVDAPELPGLIDFLVNLVPSNPFAAAADGRLLPLLVFAVLLGAAAGTLADEHRDRLVAGADAVTAAFVRLVEWVLVVAPIGIFGLVAPATARMGLDLLQSLALFVGTVIVALFLFMTIVYLPIVWALGRTGPGDFIRATLPSWTMGFTTTSSVATLPVLLRDAPRLGIGRSVSNLVVPLAVSLNRAGSGLFQGASVVYLAWLFGAEVPAGAWIGAAIACFFAAATVAPVPSASIMTLAPALSAVGAPLAGLGILLGVDRIPDMFRSGTNMVGHMMVALVTSARTGGGGVVEEGPPSTDPAADSAPPPFDAGRP